MKRAALLNLVLVAACASDDSPPGAEPTGTSSAGSSSSGPRDGPNTESSDGPQEITCIDDYHGNQELDAALVVELDAGGRSTAVVVGVGDGVAAGPPEVDGDQLAVCETSPSDFHSLQTSCPGYLAIEVRALDGRTPDLTLYDDTGQPLEQIVGVWDDFFLKPLQRHVEAGTHVVEVRHAGGGVGLYSLMVLLLPDSTCR